MTQQGVPPSDEMAAALGRLGPLARELGHDEIDIGHFLLALLRHDPELFAPKCVPGELEARLLELMPPKDPPEPIPGPCVPLTISATEAAKEAAAVAKRSHEGILEIEHVFLALFHDPSSKAAIALREVGINSWADLKPPDPL